MRDSVGYVERMHGSLDDKLRVCSFIKPGDHVLDYGCADGFVTQKMSERCPDATFLGIEQNYEFRTAARDRSSPKMSVTNHHINELELRTFDVVCFMSVLHEVYTYGLGAHAVVSAVAAARRILKPGGRIIIRDMCLPFYLAPKHLSDVADRVKMTLPEEMVSEFQKRHGVLGQDNVNHLLLKYFYTENWTTELHEDYTAMSVYDYEDLFAVLRMDIINHESYLLPWLHDKWKSDFHLSAEQLSELRSTTLLVAEF